VRIWIWFFQVLVFPGKSLAVKNFDRSAIIVALLLGHAIFITMKIENIDLGPETPEAKAALEAADASLATTPPTQEEMSWFQANRHPGGFNSESSDGELITMEDGRKYLR